jgi:ribonucleotide reductase beta subunit family protein with ferritin-like domain
VPICKTLCISKKPEKYNRLFFGDYGNFQRIDKISYPIFRTLAERSEGNTWFMNEIDYTKDKKGVEKLDSVAKRMFHLNILYQNNMDSLVPNTFGLLSDIATDTWLSYLYSRIATEEQIHCLREEDEILTSTGWKKLKHLTPEDKVANWWKKEGEKVGEITFEKPISIQRQPFTGDLIRWKNGNFTYIVTPKHRVIAYKLEENGKVQWETQQAFRADLNGYYLPLAGWKEKGRKRSLTPLERLKILFFLKGEPLPEKQSYRIQLEGEKSGELKTILEMLQIPYSSTEEGGKRVFTFTFTQPLEKGLNWIDLEEVTGEWGREFFHEMKKWENFGEIREEYFRYEGENLESGEKLIALALLSNYFPQVEERPLPKDTPKKGYRRSLQRGWEGRWKLLFTPSPTQSGGELEKDTLPFIGNIVGVEVPSTYIVVRFDGRQVAVTGNSLSYSNGLFQVFGEKVGEMLDYVYEDEILQKRTEKEIESANKFIQLVLKEEREDDVGKMAVIELLLRTYFLEGIKFPFSFFVTWTINKAYGNAIQGFSQALKLIAWDEMTIHTTTGQNVLKILMSDSEQGFLHLKEKIEKMAYQMAEETAQLEFEWNRYLQKEGPIPGYTQQIGEHFIKYWTDYRLKMLGLQPIFNEKKSDVIDWFNNYRNLNRTQVALQEADNTNYQKGTLKNDLDLFDAHQLEKMEF